MNYKIILFILSRLLFIEGFVILLSGLVSYLYGDNDFIYFLEGAALCFSVGILSIPFLLKLNKSLGKKESYIVVSLTWLTFSLFGAMPFYLSGAIPSFTNAFFETMSGFTTTGASILNDIEALSHGLLFWRSITQWLGGMGMIVLAVAILPILGIGGMQLFTAEVPGPTPDKIHPQIKGTAKRLWGIYIMFTAIETLLLLAGDMSFFDAINHSFTTMATGGYSTKQLSVAYYSSPYIQYVISLFMFIAGMNFTLSFFALKLNFKKIIHNEEFKWYFFITLIATLTLSIYLYFHQDSSSFEPTFRSALFQVISIITTTGYATDDYMLWPYFGIFIMFILMFVGGSAGSTGGGPKIMRVLVLVKNAYFEFRRMMHPKGVIPVRYNKRAIDVKIIATIQAFFVVYILIFIAGSVVLSLFGLDIDSSMGAVIACLGNIGPGIGDVGPANNFFNIPDAGKWILSFLMMVGRLELFTVLVLFTPFFWKK